MKKARLVGKRFMPCGGREERRRIQKKEELDGGPCAAERVSKSKSVFCCLARTRKTPFHCGCAREPSGSDRTAYVNEWVFRMEPGRRGPSMHVLTHTRSLTRTVATAVAVFFFFPR